MAKRKKLTLPNVRFKGMTANHERSRCTIGVTLDWADENSLDNLEILNGGRLEVDMTIRPNEDVEGQQVMPGMANVGGNAVVSGVADCKGFTRRPEKVMFNLVFNDQDVNAEGVRSITGKAGKVKIVRTGNAGAGDEEADE